MPVKAPCGEALSLVDVDVDAMRLRLLAAGRSHFAYDGTLK